jgi:DNA-binding HxlR family transcriptional regulator
MSEMFKRRTYGDRCGVARALDFVGERWALLVVRELLLGPKRFTDLRAGLPNVSADVLSQRLRELEEGEVVWRRTLDPPMGARVYELTDRGRELEPIVLALGRWGSQARFIKDDAGMSPDAVMLALKTLFDPGAAGDLRATYALRLDGQPFAARVGDGAIEVARGAPDAPDLVITGAPTTVAAALWHDASRASDLQLEGSKAAFTRFARLFPLPRS